MTDSLSGFSAVTGGDGIIRIIFRFFIDETEFFAGSTATVVTRELTRCRSEFTTVTFLTVLKL